MLTEKGLSHMAKLTDSYNLQKINPRLSKEWHPTQNGTLTPKDVTPFSYRKVWWVCNKKHEWLTSISHRSKGSGCPYCSGRTACDDNCLQTLKPELAKEWHLRKNYNLTPKDVTLSSNKKVWWICGKDHEWVAMIRSRSNGSGCPFCAGQRCPFGKRA